MTDHQTSTDAEVLFDYWQDYVKIELPEQLIERFRRLFIEGVDDSDSPVRQALVRIIFSDFAEREFTFIFNRSCYILINHWRHHPQHKEAISELIALFETSPRKLAPSPTTQRLRELVQSFKQTEQYQGLLNYRTQETHQKSKERSDKKSHPLKNSLDRYPFIYEHYHITINSTNEQRQKVSSRREQQQKKFDIQLSQYITHQKLPKNSRPAKNPTLLSDDQLNIAIQQFTGNVDGFNTYKDLAEQFRTSSRWTPCYRTFKKELYEYLIASIDPKYGNHQFNQKLYQQLQRTLPQNDTQRLSSILVVKTCRKLLDFLVIESPENPSHYIFFDLTNNLKVTPTIGLLLKIVLFCNQVKPYLEKKFAILFKHCENYTRDKGRWLVESLENLNVAFSTNFRIVNLKQL